MRPPEAAKRTIVAEDAHRARRVDSVLSPPVEGPFVRYEIRVEGHLSETLAKAFPELEHVVMSGQTVLFGRVVDEAHLYGLLARFQSLGLRVVEMRQLPE